MNLSGPLNQINDWVKEGLKKVGRLIGREAVVVGKDWLQDRWNRVFMSKNLLVLGPKGSGKTSLIMYLLSGQPFEIDDGHKRPPNPTATAAVINEKCKLQHANWQTLRKDVPGDPDLRETWKRAIDEVNPRGIIYMIDGRADEDELLEQTEAIRDNVLSNYENSLRNLSTLHVFLNFADCWADSSETVRAKKNLVDRVLEKHVVNDSFYQNIRTDVAPTQLSPEKYSWSETQRALYKFGADLVN
ncbi:MAG: ADP-ribosylation factor-like protein [bacterium]